MSDSLWPHGLQPGGFPVLHQLLELAQTHVHWVSDAIQQSHPLSSPSPSAFNLSQQWSFPMSQFFAPGSQSIGVLASASVLPMNILHWYPLGWTVLQYHSSKASIIWHSAFFIVQLSHTYKTTGKTIVLTRWTIFGKVMPMLFNMLYRLIITFLLRIKRFLISWLQSPSAVILEPPKMKPFTVSIVSPSICHEVIGPDTWSTCENKKLWLC